MNRSQLQKFAQYLIASHPNKILPSAQQLADQLLQPESNINKTSGAPDPTAGGSLQDVAAWYLDEAGVREQLRVELTNLASNGLYGTNHNVNNLRLSSGGRCNSPNGVSNFNSAGQQQQQSNTTNRSSTSSSFIQRSNSSHRSYPNSSTSLGIDSGMGSQNDIDYNDSTEVGLDWLLRYRRLTLNQNLLIGGGVSNIGGNNNTCTNSYTLNGLDLALDNYIPLSIDHSQSSSTTSNNTTTNLNTNNNNNNDHNNNHTTNNNRLYYSSTSPFHHYYYWPNSIDTQFDSNLHHCDNQLNNGNHCNGTQIPAMFAKVRELLAKRDSNGPRLLSLITEELLNCSKLPVIKSRRNQRNATIDVPSRLQTIATPRISHGQQSITDRQFPGEALSTNSVNNGYNHSSSTSLNQSPPWTVRLWEEVCLLWTCVVLSPDCSVETKRQWRYRFLTWARANRCPRDESYSIPSHFLTSIHELNDVDDDVLGQNQQSQQNQPSCQQSTRPCRRASVFRLPIEASYMSWDDVWWNHLSIHDMKLNKHEHEHREDTNGGRQNHSTSVSVDESSSDCGRIFRRPSSITPRRSIGFNSRSFQSNSSPRECQCPYCDHSGPLNEPFPLLCLRVAALRSNGYLSQALQLAVFISQRLLRSVKMKTSLAATSIINNVQRSPPQTFPSHTSWNNNCHPNDIVARRMLFNTPPNGQALRVNGISPHNVIHNSGSRYLSSLSFHNPYQPTTTNHHSYHKHIPHTNSPYSSYSCPPPPHGIGSSVGCVNGSSSNNIMMMMHPSHHNRSINSPTPMNRHVNARPLPLSYSTNPNVFAGEFFPITETDINCGLISTNCPSHTDVGWIGLPGRPILCLVECLLDAAAIVVEAANHQTPPIALPSWGHMEKASFYLCLAVKISLLSLFQQRRLVGSISRLLACQHQETRLLTLLNTIPKDVTTALTMCEILCQLLGPPITSSTSPSSLSSSSSSSSLRILNKFDYHSTALMNLWWWSSLGIIVHSDTYPVHSVAEFIPFVVLFSVLENYSLMDNSSMMGTHLTRSNSSPQLLLNNNNINNNNNSNTNGINQGCLHSQRMNYNHHGCWDYHNYLNNRVCNGGGGGSGSVETALAVNTEVSDQEFGIPSLTTATASTGTTIITGNMMDSSSQFTGNMYMNANYDNHQRYSHPHSSSNNNNNSFRWDQSQQQQQPVPDYDRCMISIPNVSVPPLPSVFSMSTQNCLKFNNSNNNNNPPVYPMFNLQNLDSNRWFTSPLSSVTATSSPTVGLPTSMTTSNNPVHSTLNNSNNRFATIDDSQLIVGNNMNNNNNNILSSNQNPQYRRCLETLKLRQTRLAVALIRVSKSHIHRLDQIVQICNQNIHSAVSLLAISQQVFAEAVGWKLRSPVNRKPNNTNLLESTYSECGCLLNSNPPSGLLLPTATNPTIESFYTRDRIFLISTAFHLALIVVLRTLSRSVHWRRREMLAWAVTTALHVGPPACLYLIYHWSSYVNPREAVSWLGPALLTAVGTLDVNTPTNVTPRMSKSLSTNKLCPTDQSNPSTIDNAMCFDHSSLFFGLSNWDDDSLNGGCASSGLMMNMNPTPDTNYSICPTWYSFCPTSFTSRSHSHSIIMAAQLLNTAVPYSKASREQITNAVRHMALQAAAKDPINCSLPALNLSVKDPIAFDAIYRLVLNSAESGGLGPIQLFSLARYMDNCGWTWRAFPFALHATRLFVLSTTQESHPVGNDVLWACLLGHRLGPGALQEILNHVIRNIHCPTLLTDILHRCRSIPCGIHVNSTNCNLNMNNNNNNNINGVDSSSSSSSSIMMNNNMTNSIPSVGRGNSCATHFCNPTPHYINNNNGTGVSGCTGKMLSLDRPPLKGLLDAAINGFVMATHMRLANISPRQYAEFVDFLTRARDTFHLLRPDGPLQFRSLVECLRQTYRGKRKLVSLLSERFG
ncbi:unnamed protein product [Schistosoma curassoni]|uniref:Ras-GEF domain-containing protein n=1 Tax=Schistosoma curassoni TaxID=6186 RepID=A0A183JWL6_9TREM|nr:unnamed protein product [Schistosoma curassoni]